MTKANETDTYFPPAEQGIKNAIANGFEESWAKLGFQIFESSCGTMVRRLYYAYEAEKSRKSVPSGEACAQEAENLGLCRIIPVEDLPGKIPDTLRKYIWVDTPENREKLKTYFSYRK